MYKRQERNEAKLSKIRDIPLSEIDDFPNHPFQVREDEDMFQLVERQAILLPTLPARISAMIEEENSSKIISRVV